MGIDDLVEVDITIVAFEYFSLSLKCTDDGLEFFQLLWFHIVHFVEQDDVAELDLLDDERSEVFLIDVLLHEFVAATKFVYHTQGVHDGNDAVQTEYSILDVFWTERRYGADGLCDRGWFADAACLDDDIIELLHVYDFFELFDEIHLQCAADASVLQSHERVVLLSHNATFLDECCVDVDFSDVIDDNCELDAFLIGQDSVKQCCLAASQITGQQQYWNFFCHFTILSYYVGACIPTLLYM